ncbi:MAG TPA: redoxin domain-containing protein [Methylomirabilota bacterium]|jgi:peroxiredoxin
MSVIEPRVLRPGEPAPDFTLPAVNREGTVSLADYRGRSPLLVAFFRGIYCPFCRRQIAKLGLSRDKLLAAGVETLGVVASNLDRTRLYFQYRPTRVPLAVDPRMDTHRAFGVRKFPVTPELTEALQTVRIDMMGELPEPVPLVEAAYALNDKDRFEYAESDGQEVEQQFPMDTGQFLVDRDGIVRWTHLESTGEGLAGMGKFPSEGELLALAREHGS